MTMTTDDNITDRHEAADALKPEGLDAEEWEMVRQHRARKAEEQRRVALWAPVLKELLDDSDDWTAAAQHFVARAGLHEWSEDEIEGFAVALIEEIGFTPKEIRGHGRVWAPG
jgi:hypothetical protein